MACARCAALSAPGDGACAPACGRCVGDQFALLEAAVSAAMLLRRFEFELEMPNGPVYPEKLDPNNPDKSIGACADLPGTFLEPSSNLPLAFLEPSWNLTLAVDCPQVRSA